MFRVCHAKDRLGMVLIIDGQLAGDHVPVAEGCCSQALSSGTHFSVFLRDVSVIDEAGRTLLRRLAEKGVRLLASGVFTSQLVESLQRATGRPPGGH